MLTADRDFLPSLRSLTPKVLSAALKIALAVVLCWDILVSFAVLYALKEHLTEIATVLAVPAMPVYECSLRGHQDRLERIGSLCTKVSAGLFGLVVVDLVAAFPLLQQTLAECVDLSLPAMRGLVFLRKIMSPYIEDLHVSKELQPTTASSAALAGRRKVPAAALPAVNIEEETGAEEMKHEQGPCAAADKAESLGSTGHAHRIPSFFTYRCRLRLFTAILCWIVQDSVPDYPIPMETLSIFIVAITALEAALMYLRVVSVQIFC